MKYEITQDQMKVLQKLLKYTEGQTCLHEVTLRGGIWETCNHCGRRWADDMGGKPSNAHEWPKAVADAQDLLGNLESLVSIPDPLPTLRPIAEMPEKVPEGCARIYWGSKTGDGSWMLPCPLIGMHDTHFIDILLPVESPEDKWRAEFEAWATQTSPQRHLWETFTEDERGWIFNAWKAAKSTPETK